MLILEIAAFSSHMSPSRVTLLYWEANMRRYRVQKIIRARALVTQTLFLFKLTYIWAKRETISLLLKKRDLKRRDCAKNFCSEGKTTQAGRGGCIHASWNWKYLVMADIWCSVNSHCCLPSSLPLSLLGHIHLITMNIFQSLLYCFQILLNSSIISFIRCKDTVF